MAVGHSILVIAYHLLTRDQAYASRAGDLYVQLHAVTGRLAPTGWSANWSALVAP